MKQVEIAIVNTELAEMNIPQEDVYKPLRFNENYLLGYWISGEGETITFYLGAQSFICKNNIYNRDLFDSILRK